MTHKTMSVANRVHNALTGYVLLDVFKHLADLKCRRDGYPKGALFLAAETMKNLQFVAMGVVSVCLTKPASGDPWIRGHQRLTELAVEEHFGSLRVQQTSAQLTARTYWRASARTMIRAHKNAKPLEAPTDEVKPLPSRELMPVSKRAFQAAMQLAAYCCNTSPTSVEESYRQWCADQGFDLPDQELGDEDDDFDLGSAETKDPAAEDQEIIQGLAENSAVLDDALAPGDRPDQEEDEEDGKQLPVELRGLPDASILAELFNVPEDGDHEQCAGDPCNLSEALQGLPMACPSIDLFDRLWRLLMYLRHWKGGGDGHWIRNPHATRVKSKNLNWQQCPANGFKAVLDILEYFRYFRYFKYFLYKIGGI